MIASRPCVTAFVVPKLATQPDELCHHLHHHQTKRRHGAGSTPTSLPTNQDERVKWC